MIHINDHIEAITEKELAEAISTLPEWRKAQAMRFRHNRGRVESAFSYLLLCDALRERGIMDPPTFVYGQEGNEGKPSLAEHPLLFFNMSHCKHAVACVVADYPVGIDIEATGRYTERLAQHTMNEDELAEIAASENKDLAFTRLWTMKEAAAKLSGQGISTHVRDLLRYSSNNIYKTIINKEKQYVVTMAKYAKYPF